MNQSDAVERLFLIIQKYLGENPDKVLNYLPPKAMAETLGLDAPRPAGDMEQLFSEIENYLQYSVRTGHSQYLNQLWSGFSMPVFMGEVISALCNTSMYTYEVAPVALLIERKMIAELLQIIGFTAGEGQFTTGGSNGNMLAMMIARNRAVEDCKKRGIHGVPLVGFVSEDAHYSFDKAANILGLGTNSLVKVPIDHTSTMNPVLLEKAIFDAKAAGNIPFFVGATAGTTIRGTFDDLTTIGAVARQNDMWFHVDGAWGGSVLLSSARDQHLAAIEEADSLVWDAHKMMGMTLMCSLFAVREKGHFDDVLKLGDTSYIFHEDDDLVDPGLLSLQCGRRNDILKFWLEWCYTGKEGYQKRIDNFMSLIAYARAKVVADPKLELVDENGILSVCFRYTDDQISDLNAFNIDVRRDLYEAGASFVNYSYLGEIAVIRLVISNKNVGKPDIDRFFENFDKQARAKLLDIRSDS